MEALVVGQELGLSPSTEPTRHERLETYLRDFGDETSIGIAEDFNRADLLMSPYSVLIPVAAHQDAAKIVPAMSEYARQDDADPFTIFMLLNYPADESFDKVGDAIIEVETAKRQFPQLDIRYSVMGYGEPIIGQIRNDLWDAALRLALKDGLYGRPGGDVIGLNHDIDTERISHHYMRNVQNFYRMKQAGFDAAGMTEYPLPPRHTQLKHAYPFDTHPNIARAIFWSDLTFRQAMRGGGFSAGLAIPFSHFAKRRGFDRLASIQECAPLEPQDGAGIQGTAMDTSPRRYIMRIGNDTRAEIWTPDTFGASDTCRDPNALPADISHSDLEERIFETFERDLAFCCSRWNRRSINGLVLRSVARGSFNEQAFVEDVRGVVDRNLNLARYALAGVIGSPLLASLVDESVTDRFTAEAADALRGLVAQPFAMSGR